MSSTLPAVRSFLHPLHGLLLAFPVALFPAALLSDVAYLKTAEIQWSNFSSWLIVGGLVFGAMALLWGVVLAIWSRRTSIGKRATVYCAVLAGMWIAGLVNAFQHSRDGWSSVGTFGLILSMLSALLAIAASWIAHRHAKEIGR